MSRRYQALDTYQARQLNAAAVGGIHELAATTGYQPAAPAGDDRPDDWHHRPMHLAPFRCDQCDQPFHVRRHLETHACLALTRETTGDPCITTLMTHLERTI